MCDQKNGKLTYCWLPPYSFKINFQGFSLIFLWTPKGSISQEYFLNFFSIKYIAPWLQKTFIFMMFRSLKNTFLGQKNWICLFLRMSLSKSLPQVLIIITSLRKNKLFLPNKPVWKSVFYSRKWEGLWSW